MNILSFSNEGARSMVRDIVAFFVVIAFSQSVAVWADLAAWIG